MSKQIDIFDSNYIGEDHTKTELPKTSETKKFLKEPLPEASFTEYGTSKPTRTIIKAKITNG